VSTSPRVPKAATSGQSADSAATAGPLRASGLAKKIRAAGGVVWRRVPAGIEVVLVHRPAYDDWALPKGKVEARESDEEAALREVREETGLSCRLGPKGAQRWSGTGQ